MHGRNYPPADICRIVGSPFPHNTLSSKYSKKWYANIHPFNRLVARCPCFWYPVRKDRAQKTNLFLCPLCCLDWLDSDPVSTKHPFGAYHGSIQPCGVCLQRHRYQHGFYN